jgi:hypothetical protein
MVGALEIGFMIFKYSANSIGMIAAGFYFDVFDSYEL